MNEDRSKSGNVRRRTGIFVLIATVLFVAAVIEAGALRDMFRKTATLRILLPEDGFSGLAEGSSVEVLGTRAGTVTKIVIDPTQNFHAIATLEPEMTPFVRRDSKVFIRKQFGIAGAAYLEITRGRGEVLDWQYAVLSASTAGSPTDSLGQLADEVQKRILPTIDEMRRAVTAIADLAETLRAPDGAVQRTATDLAEIAARLKQGEGSVGRLLTDETLARDLEATATSARRQIDAAQLGRISNELSASLATLNGLIEQAQGTLPDVSRVAKNSAAATSTLPVTLIQLDRTLSELEALLKQARRSWLLGSGGGAPAPGSDELPRLSPTEARP
jgi:phospholipid/cholesterol/gamma-HCH transport system substrate-binding protein